MSMLISNNSILKSLKGIWAIRNVQQNISLAPIEMGYRFIPAFPVIDNIEAKKSCYNSEVLVLLYNPCQYTTIPRLYLLSTEMKIYSKRDL